MRAYVFRGASDGKKVVVADYRTAAVWDLNTGEKLVNLHQSDEDVAASALSKDGRYAATGPGPGGEIPTHHDNAIRIWDLKSQRVVDRIELQASELQFSSDGKYLLITGLSSVWLWNLKTHQFDFSYPAHYAEIRADSSEFITGDIRRIILWDLKTKKQKVVLDCPFSRYFFESMQLSPDRKQLLTSCSDYTIRSWDLATGHLFHEFQGQPTFVIGAGYAQNGKLVASPCLDGTLRVWDASTAKLIHTIDCKDQIMDQQFSPDGNRCLLDTRQGVFLVDIPNGKILGLLEPFVPVNDSCSAGDRLVLLRDPIQIYDWKTGNLIKVVTPKK